MIETVPIFTRLNEPLLYDNIVEQSEIDEIPCDKTSIQNLNQANGQLSIHYSGDFSYLLAGQDSGFMVCCRFCTRDNNATNPNANITLASNWFSYLFEDAHLRLVGATIEHIRHYGVVIDVFYHMENAEFRYQTGSLVGFIPDTSSEVSNSIGRRVGDIAGNNVNAHIANVNHANQRNVHANENFNGF